METLIDGSLDCSVNLVYNKKGWLSLASKVRILGHCIVDEVQKLSWRPSIASIYRLHSVPAHFGHNSGKSSLACSRWSVQTQKLFVLKGKLLVGCHVLNISRSIYSFEGNVLFELESRLLGD